jgi:hypothetical protein
LFEFFLQINSELIQTNFVICKKNSLCYHKHTGKGLIKETITQTWEHLCNAMMYECMHANFEFIQIFGMLQL